MKILVDVASIAKRALFAGADKEHGTYEFDANKGKEVLINSAQYGYDNLANSMAATLTNLGINPKDMVLVLDGVDSRKLRQSKYAGYKAGRHKPDGFYREYNRMLKIFLTDMLALGAQVAQHHGLEADDLIAWLCENLVEDRVLVLTNDHDLLVLAKHSHVAVYSNGELNPKPYGDFPYEFIDVYKATVGDSSDKIPGAKGFGPKAFAAMYAQFGDNGLAVLRKLIQGRCLVKLQEDVADLPVLQKLIDYAMDVELSLDLAKLMSNRVNPDKIQWQHGVNSGAEVHPFLRAWKQSVKGVTAANFTECFNFIRQQAADNDRVALDIETSTPEESDEWLFAIKGKEGVGVDVFGSQLTGLSLTLGSNFQHTFYFSIDHADTDNCLPEQVEEVLKFLNPTHRFVIQNANFELPVLFNTYGWFLRDVDDTKLMASYVDENAPLGLKQNSLRWLGYEQASYENTVRAEDGRLRKMNELSLAEVLKYGTDDTLCTAALYQWYQLHMMLEQVWQIYRDVEIGAAYWTAQAFLDGIKTDQVSLSKMIARDAKAKAEQEQILHQYLVHTGWEGSVFVPATEESRSTPAWIKYAFELVYGHELKASVRKFDRLLEAVKAQDDGSHALSTVLLNAPLKQLNEFVRSHFTAKPDFNASSPKQMQTLLYTTMGLPIRLRNKPTDLMRLKNQEGTPQTDETAIKSALHYDLPETEPYAERRTTLGALLQIKMYNTREGLFYEQYPKLPHWKDNRIHGSLNQCSTVTRRYSSSQPNLQQQPKKKGDLRNIIVPHHANAMIVSLDFSAQELRLTAEISQDPNMLSCYVGDDLRDMHSLTAAGIAKMPYDEFKTILDDEIHEKHKWAKGIRNLGKTVNFAGLYGAAAPKMAQTLMVTEDEAQSYINARADVFSRVEEWKTEVIRSARDLGYARTLLGARRHLPDLKSSNKWDAAKAERQAVNYMIQGSGAEMTKLAMSRVWYSNLRQRYDMRFLAPIHDEVVFSIAIADMPAALPEIHAAMTAQYAQMAVPIESSVSFGWNFGEQHEMGDEVKPTPELVRHHLAEFFGIKEAA